MKKITAATGVFIIGFLGSVTSFAEEKACMLEGSVKAMGITTEIKDCIQNDGLSAAQFNEVCSSLSQAGAALGGEPAKITRMASCPTPAQGSCHKLFGQPVSGFYYKRDAESLAYAKKGCEQQGGTWKQY